MPKNLFISCSLLTLILMSCTSSPIQPIDSGSSVIPTPSIELSGGTVDVSDAHSTLDNPPYPSQGTRN